MNNFKLTRYLTRLAVIGILLSGLLSLTAGAITERSPVVIDDFNDGDASDWGFFGGNAAGGGGGAADDRPQEGSHYLTTGWGGEGSNSVFYGGFFRNLDISDQSSFRFNCNVVKSEQFRIINAWMENLIIKNQCF